MANAIRLYRAVGGAAGCRALAKAFYARVEKDPLLRPLFPSTFTCAIEEFSAFLVQFLGGEADATQRRWWVSLRESHSRFAIGQPERAAWLRAMTATLDDETSLADAGVRSELLKFFTYSSAHVVNRKEIPAPEPPAGGELAPLWEEQLALDEAAALIHSPGGGGRFIELLNGPALQTRFSRSPAIHASVLAMAATSGIPLLREYAAKELLANPSLIHERYKGWRTLLHDASAAGDVGLVEQLLAMGAGDPAQERNWHSPLYCAANECSAPGASQVVAALLQRDPSSVNDANGVKRCTALHMAARRGNRDVIGTLLDHGADIEARDSAGDTPLRRAVNCNQGGAAKLLLARGADPRSKGSRSLTPASAARSSQMKQLFA